MIGEFERALIDYKYNQGSPEAVTNYWRVKLPDIDIPDCDWTAAEICRPMKDIRADDIPTIMVPITNEITLPFLGRRFPLLASRSIKDDTGVTDTHHTEGWVKVYSSIYPPNWRVSRIIAEAFCVTQKYLGQRESTYILASQASHDLTGHYLDEKGTWSWLFGSRLNDDIVIAGFIPEGNVVVDSAGYSSTPNHGGWRFEEIRAK